VISKIEDIFEAMTDCVMDEKKELVIPLKTRDKKKSKSDDLGPTKRRKKSETGTITFPSKSPQEAWKFSRFELSIAIGRMLIGSSCATPDS
jgi:meiotic recombination protein SPO11